MPSTVPFHTTLSVGDAPVVVFDRQLRGLLENEPVTVPLVMVTALSLGVQPDSAPFTADGLVPPPEWVSAGEKDTLADREQLTEPGAAPANFGATSASSLDPVTVGLGVEASTTPLDASIAATITTIATRMNHFGILMNYSL
jgi:hypothetical protein